MKHEDLHKQALTSSLSETLIAIRNDVNEIKIIQNKSPIILATVYIVVGIILGTQIEVWIPYAKDGISIFRTVYK